MFLKKVFAIYTVSGILEKAERGAFKGQKARYDKAVHTLDRKESERENPNRHAGVSGIRVHRHPVVFQNA